MERAKGIEPSYAAWEAAVLPLNYARKARTYNRHHYLREMREAMLSYEYHFKNLLEAKRSLEAISEYLTA